MHAKPCVAILACMALAPWPAWSASATDENDAAAASKSGKATVRSKSEGHEKGDKQAGKASFYSKHLAGQKTTSGEPYDPSRMTAAHRSLPLGTQVKVVNPKNDKSVVVTVNDRGPIPKDRMIDLSNAAASEIGMTKAGVTKVQTEVVGKKDMPKDASAPPTRSAP